MYKAVIFDLDGTLLNTLGDLHASVNYALKKHGLPERSIDEVRAFVGNGIRKLIERAVDGRADNDAVLEDFRVHYGIHCNDTTAPYDNIPKLLNALKERGIKTAVVTNKIDSAAKVLCKNYFGDVLSAVVGDVEGRKQKPSPEPVLAALDEIGISANEAVYIGDSDVDVVTAKNSGMDCIAVTWGFRGRDVLVNAGAKRLADDPMQILEFVGAER